GAGLIGFGSGLFAVATLTAAMTLPETGLAGRGLALGAWGAAQATAAGLAIALGGALKDAVAQLGSTGLLGSALSEPSTGYSVVYHTEIALMFATLIVLGPLARHLHSPSATPPGGGTARLGLADFPT
ncbi:MAG: PucC family protein, partial [Pseudomonadota bacterium]